MFSLDILISTWSIPLIKFLMANKMTILGIYMVLDKLAKNTKTTIDDNILTMFKNLFLKLTGKGNKVNKLYQTAKSNNLLKDTEEIKKLLK